MKMLASGAWSFGLACSLCASCTGGGGGHPDTAPVSSGSGATSATSSTPSANGDAVDAAALAPAIQSAPPTATVSDEKVRYERAVAWRIQGGPTVVVLADRGDCDSLKPRRDASRSSFEKSRLDVVFSSQLDPDGSEHMRAYRIDPLAGISGRVAGALTGGGASPLVATFDLDFYEKEGPTIVMKGRAQPRLCGQLPPSVSSKKPRPQPGLTVSVAGKSFPIEGALLRVVDRTHDIVELSTEPLSCGPAGDETPNDELLLVYGSYTQSNPKPLLLAGLSFPYRIEGEMRTATMGTKVTSRSRDSATADLDWSFEQGGYKGTVKGTADLLVCKD